MESTALEHGIAPENVHDTLRRWMLADGLPLVLDLEASRGTTLVDARSGRSYLDFFGCFGSNPIGWNHPALRDPAWLKSAEGALVNRPSNSDLYSPEMAEFVDAFARLALPAGCRHLFFVDGGALAVENALKTAFDWKVRRNRGKGVDADVGTRILHFRHAFHGRTGYTMSLTNTLPVKTALFPKFDWPRVSSPALIFPVTEDSLRSVRAAEQAALGEVDAAFERYGDDIAAILIEPIQCEGGDRHFRAEFLQALQARCERYDCLFACDEVQTGFFTSGKPWAFQHYGIQPDIVSFGKKAQQCGLFAGPKIDLVPGNVFEIAGRINSTWGGNLVDMLRATRILQVVHEERLADNAARQGLRWLEGMAAVVARHPRLLSGVRGLGLLMAFDLPGSELRDKFLGSLKEHGLLALKCGERTIRFRPHLAVGSDDVDQAIELTAATCADFRA
ncbi:MAG: L-lysine 6-transaminase [Planctomycetota bacterium]|nr:MAG: L-lysine 6-transaminase [Planctomycetota bacterium]